MSIPTCPADPNHLDRDPRREHRRYTDRPEVRWAAVRWLAPALACALLAACDPSPSTLTTIPPGTPTTTTSIVDDTCDQLATDTARYLELVLRVLDETSLEEFRDRDRWPEALFALQLQGADLDLRSDALGCDPAAVQEQAFQRARLGHDGRLAGYLLELLGLD
jgi:hypothetical protein